MLAALLRYYKTNLLLALVLAVVIILRYQNVFAALAFLPISVVTGQPILALFIPQVLAGTLLSVFLLDLEFVLQAYFYDPASTFSTGLRDLLAQKNWVGLAGFAEAHQDEIKNPVLRSSVFQVVLIILCAYLVISRVSLLGTSFALGVLLQSIILGYQRRHKDWFWEIKLALSNTAISIYFVVVSLALLYLLTV